MVFCTLEEGCIKEYVNKLDKKRVKRAAIRYSKTNRGTS
jgi:hypothetical protein